MKKNFIKFIFLILIIGSSLSAIAQGDIATLFKSGVTDLNTVLNGYMKPMGTGFAANLGSNWYNTGAPHKLLGFDLTIGFGAAMAPTADQTFSLLGLKNLKPIGSETTAPSFAGTGKKGVDLQLLQPATLTVGGQTIANPHGGEKITSFTTPPGVLNLIPGVSGQLGLGLPFGTQIMVRFVPTVTASGFKMGLWGIGIQHNFKQWIPVVKDLPFDASIVIGYTKLTVGYDFAPADMITPDKLVDASVGYISPVGIAFNNQKIKLTSNALTANVVVSKKLLFFTPYLGFGFTSSKFDLGFKGNYPVVGDPYVKLVTVGGQQVPDVTDPNNGKLQITNMVDPIDLNYKNMMPNLTVGFRLKILWVLAFHAQYTLQKYPIISGGFGINFR
jgi:hypothetical protein